MDFQQFLDTHPVFTAKELGELQRQKGLANRWTRKALLAHHRKQGHIVRVLRGLYAVVPPGCTPDKCPVDSFVLASKLREDAVLAYHTALDFYGKAYSAFQSFFVLTRHPVKPAAWRGATFRTVLFPKALLRKQKETYGVVTDNSRNVPLCVTSYERTLVDVLDRPDLAGGWEEIWRSLEMVEFFDLDRVVEYALLFDNATTAAKVGYFLDQHRERLHVTDAHLQPLRDRRPKEPHYLDRGSPRETRLVKDWSLVVPVEVAGRTWEELR